MQRTRKAQAGVETQDKGPEQVESLESYAIGVVLPTNPAYPNTRFFSGVLKDAAGTEHAISVERTGHNGSSVWSVALGRGRTAQQIGELSRVNGHLEGTIGVKNPTRVGGVFQRGGGIVLIPGDKIRANAPERQKKTLSQLLAEAVAAEAPQSEEQTGVECPF